MSLKVTRHFKIYSIIQFKINSNSSSTLQIDRRNSGNYENLTVLVNDANGIKLMDGDSIQVPYVNPVFEKTKQVTITGEVKIPELIL